MKRYLIFALICAFIFSPSAPLAQEEDAEYTYGIVIAVDAEKNEITIREYDWNTSSGTPTTYSVDPDVKVDGAESWQDIPIGSDIDIDLKVNNKGQKVVRYISHYTD